MSGSLLKVLFLDAFASAAANRSAVPAEKRSLKQKTEKEKTPRFVSSMPHG
jgi:hypothetical protein